MRKYNHLQPALGRHHRVRSRVDGRGHQHRRSRIRAAQLPAPRRPLPDLWDEGHWKAVKCRRKAVKCQRKAVKCQRKAVPPRPALPQGHRPAPPAARRNATRVSNAASEIVRGCLARPSSPRPIRAAPCAPRRQRTKGRKNNKHCESAAKGRERETVAHTHACRRRTGWPSGPGNDARLDSVRTVLDSEKTAHGTVSRERTISKRTQQQRVYINYSDSTSTLAGHLQRIDHRLCRVCACRVCSCLPTRVCLCACVKCERLYALVDHTALALLLKYAPRSTLPPPAFSASKASITIIQATP